MQPSLSLSLSALAAKTRVGGKKQPLLLMPPPLPTGGRDTPEIKEFRHRRPDCNVYVDRATHGGLTDVQGQRQGGSLINDDNDEHGGNNNDSGGATKMPVGVRDKFKAPSKRTRRNLASWGS